MSKECLNDCPVIVAIQKNIDADLLPEFFNNGLNSAVKATDECMGPGEIEIKRRKGLLSKTIVEPRKICVYLDTVQNEIILTSD